MLKVNNLLKLKSFLLLWISQGISLLGSEMTNFALTVHVFGEHKSAMSVALLRTFYVLPSILLCFAAGALADRWDKKKVMLAGIGAGALATGAMLFLSGWGQLEVWHLYAINFSVSIVNAFMNPAVYVVTTLLSPKAQYVRVSGMMMLSVTASKILAPFTATGLITAGGIEAVFIADIITFVIAFSVLLLFVKIPPLPEGNGPKEAFLKSCLTGFTYLKEHNAVWKLILFMAFINLLANLGGDSSMLPSMVLARTGENTIVLSTVLSAASFGGLLGSVTVIASRQAKSKIRVMFLTCAGAFLISDLSYALGQTPAVWLAGALLGNILIPFITANNAALMRSNVPVQLQGRVFAARDTVQYAPIPLGLFLGGFMADRVFEPLMLSDTPLQQLLSLFVGTGKGAGMAVIMLITGVTGFTVSLVCSRNTIYRELE